MKRPTQTVMNFGPEYDLVQDEASTTELASTYGVEAYPYMFIKVSDGEILELWGVSFPALDYVAYRLA